MNHEGKSPISVGISRAMQIFVHVAVVSAMLSVPACKGHKNAEMAEKEGAVEQHQHAGQEATGGEKPGAQERKIRYWTCSMHPEVVRDAPGTCPICGMDLVPVYEDGGGTGTGVIRIDPVTVQNMGVRTATAVRKPLFMTIRLAGNVTYDEQRVEHVHTKVQGWIDALFVDTTGEMVSKGQKLLSIYSPELVSTQEEYLQALRYAEKTSASGFEDVTRGASSLVEASKRRLAFMDIDETQIRELERSGEVRKTMVLRSPASGIVIVKKVLEGMKVTPGDELYTIADISRVWVMGSVYEYELPFVKKGQEAEMSLPYEPGVTYKGKITFVYPFLSTKTRTAQVRIEVSNPGLKLKPDMYVDVVVKSKIANDALQIPSEAVIRTGTRSIVIAALGDGKFMPKEVVLGPEGRGSIQVRTGLEEGETVVTSGQFLIDSESNLREAINKMIEAKEAAAPTEAAAPGTPETAKEIPAPSGVQLDGKQSALMEDIVAAYLDMHAALIAESLPEVDAGAEAMAALAKQLEESDPAGSLQPLTSALRASEGELRSHDLKRAREAFAKMSSAMADYMKGAGADQARRGHIKVYVCPMEKKRWVQKEGTILNPYMGKEMYSCGVEEKL